jgi:2,3-bisphosphoglycerate-independent phosphoglycerate mutase
VIVERRRVDRNFPAWGIELCAFLDGMPIPKFPDVRVATKYATEHRCGVVFHGAGLSDKMSGTDPLKDQCVPSGCRVLQSAARLCRAVSDISGVCCSASRS